MPQEIEAKFRLADPTPLREALQAAGTSRLTRGLESSRLFDTPDRRLMANDCGLRIRESRSPAGEAPAPATLTFKGPRAAGDIKQREELETPVSDAATLAAILARIGFQEVVRYETRRETWRLDACVVCIDELPKLGWFAEIEGPSVAAVEAAQRQLDLADSTPLRKTYVELAAEHGDPDAAGCRVLSFQPLLRPA